MPGTLKYSLGNVKLEKPIEKRNSLHISLKGLVLNDYGAFLKEEEKLDQLILSTLRDGPLRQIEIVRRIGLTLSHIQRHLDALSAQGAISSFSQNARHKVYFLPLDASGANRKE